MSNTWKIYILAVVSFLVGTSEFIIAGILDKVADDLGISLAAAGQLITVFSLAYAFGTPFLLAAAAKVQSKKLLLYALAVFVLSHIATLVLPGFAFLIGFRIIMALASGVFVVTALTVAAKLAPPEKQGSAIATLVMGFSTALIVGVPLGRLAASIYDWKLVFGALGILGILAIVLVAFTIPNTESEQPVPLREQVSLLRNPKIAVALLITFFWIGGYSITYTYISPFLLTITGMSEQAVSIALFAFGVASLIGSKLGGFSTDRWGFSPTLVGGMLVHTVVLVLISLAAHSTALMFPLLMLWSFSAWSSGPTQQYHLLTLAPGASSIMLSLNSSVLQLAMAAGAGMGGVIVEHSSLSVTSWIGAAGVFAAVLIAASLLGYFRAGAAARAKRENATIQKARV
ncbi:MFS transporter, DHA1 family, purine base/nucleoside efflux pump [Paenibacillus sp. UNCCL117]|uniref:MFS transporter n=1 Tax=unclassified Paenibacillus TaxID=185978 RepID=UPI0008855056|nr:MULTISPECIES: MFS transporter [unclassified Paenibacillus]SDC14173.1 MFS transporter, DHA1 family, purine base/nucleoside efflux pump [Paenibacillus sp. cl123]SFW17245.1 MFS transporter, DHA1 family, purine base/nucleoside efflux pump [Paenibacillus sp. UNCCL117]